MSRGAVNYHAGLEAERSVARRYLRAGYTFAAHRFRAGRGEIDLIMRRGAEVIFIEVKKSVSHAQAASALGPRQIARIFETATRFVSGEPKGQDTDMRFDVALVDAHGEIEVLENALIA
ncbi:putative endonuclease [Litoreibacter ponti]|uniref:UPF0102 protein C8N43_3261 n=1 Tax=Litoreibacter ponti TaxID=1510457 RepID=A0A2T6BEG3_9RHOB|nr:YraN family protein [Litoreibacter ponti]PTX54446.1 putative endonuclease [Litoreibacter ponti]